MSENTTSIRQQVYDRYAQAVRASADIHGTIPHCDSYVLHAPFTCVYCDVRPELHDARRQLGIRYTGGATTETFRPYPCPAEVSRPLDIIEKWGGNVAKPHVCEDEWEYGDAPLVAAKGTDTFTYDKDAQGFSLVAKDTKVCLHSAQSWYLKENGDHGCDDCDEDKRDQLKKVYDNAFELPDAFAGLSVGKAGDVAAGGEWQDPSDKILGPLGKNAVKLCSREKPHTDPCNGWVSEECGKGPFYTEYRGPGSIDQLCRDSYDIAVTHGFWEDDAIPLQYKVSEKIALIHSELSEALEELRNGAFDNWTETRYNEERGGKPEGFASELADAVIRIADLARHLDIDLQKVIYDKQEYNRGRPYKHGRNF